MSIDLLADLVDIGALAIHDGRTVRVEQGGIDVLVIEDQQAVVALPTAQPRIHGEEVHSVVVHADLLGLIFRIVAGVFQPGWVAPGNRGTPGNEGGRGIASGYSDGVGPGNSHWRKGQAGTTSERNILDATGHRLCRLREAGKGCAEKGQGADGCAAREDFASAEGNHILDMRIRRMVTGQLVPVAEQNVVVLSNHGAAP